MDTNPRGPLEWDLYLWGLALGSALFCGLVKWWAVYRRRYPRIFDWLEFNGEVFTSGFVSLTVFMALDSIRFPIGACVFLGGVCGHQGAHFLFNIERALERRLIRIIDNTGSPTIEEPPTSEAKDDESNPPPA